MSSTTSLTSQTSVPMPNGFSQRFKQHFCVFKFTTPQNWPDKEVADECLSRLRNNDYQLTQNLDSGFVQGHPGSGQVTQLAFMTVTYETDEEVIASLAKWEMQLFNNTWQFPLDNEVNWLNSPNQRDTFWLAKA